MKKSRLIIGFLISILGSVYPAFCRTIFVDSFDTASMNNWWTVSGNWTQHDGYISAQANLGTATITAKISNGKATYICNMGVGHQTDKDNEIIWIIKNADGSKNFGFQLYSYNLAYFKEYGYVYINGAAELLYQDVNYTWFRIDFTPPRTLDYYLSDDGITWTYQTTRTMPNDFFPYSMGWTSVNTGSNSDAWNIVYYTRVEISTRRVIITK
ncbi:MAG: hypothetical protein HY796_10400 [Elusimicrobia bacterium]|nr:hypothetical protein [Elusimicrobiota bacterium]